MMNWRFWSGTKQKFRSKASGRKRHAAKGKPLGSSLERAASELSIAPNQYVPSFEFLESRQLMAANIFTVTITDDLDGGAATLVDAQADGGGLSLREAIRFANATANDPSEPDIIEFDIGSDPSLVQTITIDSSLVVTDAVVIDGFSQGEASANTLDVGSDAIYRIELQSGALSTADGTALLSIEGSDAAGTVIQGLVINNLMGSQDAIALRNTSGVKVSGNYIGIDVTGMNSLDMGRNGIRIDGGGNNTIGGAEVADRNVIAGDYQSEAGGTFGDRAMVAIGLGGDSAGNVIAGNYLGTDATGNARIVANTNAGNTKRQVGVLLNGTGTDSTTIRQNVITTQFLGIRAKSLAITDTLIEENSIGVGADGITNLGNTGSSTSTGIYLFATDTTIQRNIIANHRDDGIFLAEIGATGVRISQNSIYNNGDQGIDLENTGSNDSDDSDTGANLRMNYPEMINTFIDDDGELYATVTIRSLPDYQAYPIVVEFFEADGIQGKRFLGDVVVTEPGTVTLHVGNALTLGVSDATPLVATATDAEGNTSEFSASSAEVVTVGMAYAELPVGISSVFLVTNTESGSATAGSLGWAVSKANATEGFDAILFALDALDVANIQTTEGTFLFETDSTYTLTDQVYIDGLSQAGSSANTSDVGDNANFQIEVRAGAGLSTGSGTALFYFNGAGADGSTLRGFVLNTLRGDQDAVRLNGVSQTTVAANYIGVSSDGLTNTDMGRDGIRIDGGGNNTVGGTAVGDRNVIAGHYLTNNGTTGGNRGMVAIGLATGSTGNWVVGNYLGTDKTGLVRLVSNQNASNVTRQVGVLVTNADSDANTISGNVITTEFLGIRLSNNNIQDVLIIGNSIGVGADGVANIGLTGSTTSTGIYLDATNITIQGNVIANNRDDGINVASVNATGIRITQNSFYNNGDEAIELNGGDSNDAGDPDTGANQRLNFPDMSSAFIDANGDLYLSLNIDSLPANQPFPITVELYEADDGEGRRYLTSFTIEDPGVQSVLVGNAAALGIGNSLSLIATATDASGNTSEFSTYSVTVGTIAYAYSEIPPDIERIYLVTNTDTSASVSGSLAWAVSQANANAGYDAVLFALDENNATLDRTAAGAFLISGSGFVDVTDRIYIDGYSQLGTAQNTLAEGSDAVLQVMVQRTPSSGNTIRLYTGSSDSTVRGLLLSNSGTGSTAGMIGIQNSTGNVVAGNFFGLDADGTTPVDSNTTALWLHASATDNTIGGLAAGDRNLFGGIYSPTGSAYALNIFGSNNLIANNLIGVDRTGNASSLSTPSGAQVYGVMIDGGSGNTVGGEIAGAGNVISGLTRDGIYLRNNASGNLVAGNIIGLNASGDTQLGNGRYGIMVYGAEYNTIGSSNPLGRNVIAGNTSIGINLQSNGSTQSSGNLLIGNFVGVGADGQTGIGNSRGIVLSSASDVTVGGDQAGWGNVISGNSGHGIDIGGASSGNWIAGNYVGVAADGVSNVANTGIGIQLSGSSVVQNTIGGLGEFGRNVVAGNGANGIFVRNSASGNLVINNYVGVAADGSTVYGNGSTGNSSVLFYEGASYNTAGGPTEAYGNYVVGVAGVSGAHGINVGGTGNLVQNNFVGIAPDGSAHGMSQYGIIVGSGTGNTLLSNHLANNVSGGISLSAGANNDQSAPTITGAVIDRDGTLTIQYESDASWQYGLGALTLQFFTGMQGRDLFREDMVTQVGAGTITISNATDLGFYGGQFIVATATDAEGDTSRLSNAVSIVDWGQLPEDIDQVYVVTNTSDSVNTTGSFRWAIAQANSSPDTYDAIVFGIAKLGVQTITIGGIIDVSSQVYIDGYTQDGAVANSLEEGSDAILQVVINKTNSGSGFRFYNGADDSTLRGLVFRSSADVSNANDIAAVKVENVTGVTLAGNFFNTDETGNTATQAGNSALIIKGNSRDNTIGGTSAADRNVFGGDYSAATSAQGAGLIVIQNISGGTVNDNVLVGNHIGVSADGTHSIVVPNGSTVTTYGVHIRGSANSDNVVRDNLIAANGTTALRVEASGTLITGNAIGLKSDGTALGGGSLEGIVLTSSASQTTIGGSTNGLGNQLAEGSNAAVLVQSSGNRILGNHIGTEGSGTMGAGQTGVGLLIESAHNTIGGMDAGSQNVISGNAIGIELATGATGNLVQGNFLGLDASGEIVVANSSHGIFINGGHLNTIGGTGGFEANWIGGNGGDGVAIDGDASGNVIVGNFIGVDGAHLANTTHGNAGAGVHVLTGNANRITANSIAFNVDKGILIEAGAQGDITSPAVAGAFLDTNGDLFISLTADNGWNYGSGGVNLELFEGVGGQGITLIASEVYASSGTYTYKIADASGQGIELGHELVTTVTDGVGNTSEFSVGVVVTAISSVLPEDIVHLFIVTETTGGVNDVGTLAWAVEQADTMAGHDAILFNISGAGPHVINTGIIQVDSKIFIDGYSQQGAQVNTLSEGSDASLRVIVQRTTGTGSTFYLTAGASGSTVRGLVFQSGVTGGNSDLGALKLENVTGVTVAGNFINTDHTGNVATATSTSGIIIKGNSSANTIGGTTVADRNVIGGDYSTSTATDNDLISLNSSLGTAHDNVVLGNRIGVSADGTSSLVETGATGKAPYGVHVRGAENTQNLIQNNLIATRDFTAVRIESGTVQIVGNLIGLEADGSVLSVRNQYGIVLDQNAAEATIGGLSSSEANVIAAASNAAIRVSSSGNKIVGNFVGTDATGMTGTGQVGVGILLEATAHDNTIGGMSANARNVIAGNSIGIRLVDGAANNLIVGNFIGVGADGTTAIGNASYGIEFAGLGTSNNTLGGLVAGSGNVIAGNGGDGILLRDQASANLVLGNRVGLAADDATLLGNGGHGILLDGAHQNTIGSLANSLAANVIVGNTGDGIAFANGATANRVVGNAIGVDSNQSANSTWGNGGVGISVASLSSENSFLSNSIAYNAGGGIARETGSNEDQAAPQIDSVTFDSATGKLTIQYHVANGAVGLLVQFFLSIGGQGAALLGEVADAIGDGSTNTAEFILAADAFVSGNAIVATATRTSGSTSEFSNSQSIGFSPVISGVTTATDIDDNQSATPFSGVTIEEPEGDTVEVRLTLDQNDNGILEDASGQFVWNAGGYYVFMGSAAVATTSIQGVVFVPTEDQVAAGQVVTTRISIEVIDSTGLSATNNDTLLNVTSFNDPPEITGISTPISISDEQTTLPFAGVSIDDKDAAVTLSVAVRLSSSANGVLVGTGFLYSSERGQYEYSGTPAQVTAAIQSLVFHPTLNQVAPGGSTTTLFTIEVNDGSIVTTNSATQVEVSSVNDPVNLSGVNVGPQTTLDSQGIHLFAQATVADADNENLTVQITLSSAINGRLAGGNFVETGPGVYTFVGHASAATAALRALVYLPTTEQVPVGDSVTTHFQIEVTDGLLTSSTADTTVIAISYNNTPTIDGLPSGSIAYPSSRGWISLLQGGAPYVVDPDIDALQGGRLDVRFSSGATPFDHLRLQTAGSPFSVAGGVLYYNQDRVGTMLSDGSGNSPISINLEAMDTTQLSQLLGMIGYSNTSNRFGIDRTRGVTISLVDGGGTALGASNSTSVSVGILLPAPFLAIPDGALPQFDLSTGGSAGLNNSFPTVRNFLHLDPVGAQPITQTNILTAFGPMQREMMLNEFLGNSNPSQVAADRLFTNGWTHYTTFQVATQALLQQSLFSGSESFDKQHQYAADRIAMVVTDGIFEGLTDTEIASRVMSDFDDVKSRMGFEFELDPYAVDQFVRDARRIFLELMRGGGDRRTQVLPSGPLEVPPAAIMEVEARQGVDSTRDERESPTPDASSTPQAEPITQSRNFREGWLYAADSTEQAVDSLLSSHDSDEITLASVVGEGTMVELASQSLDETVGDATQQSEENTDSQLARAETLPEAAGIALLSTKMVTEHQRSPQSSDSKQKRSLWSYWRSR